MRMFIVAASIIAQAAPLAANPIVVMEANHGTIKIELFEDKRRSRKTFAYVDD